MFEADAAMSADGAYAGVMDLLSFGQAVLRRADGAPRPFLCEGSPFDSDVFLVGINPAAATPLWPHWSPERGCDRAAWLDAYREDHPREGPTRKRLELLQSVIGPERVLETNVFHHRSRREADLASAQKQTTVFELLLETLKPRVVFVHGKSAVTHVERMTGAKTKHRDFVSASWRGATFELITGHHLAYQWSYQDVETLGRRIKERCPAAR